MLLPTRDGTASAKSTRLAVLAALLGVVVLPVGLVALLRPPSGVPPSATEPTTAPSAPSTAGPAREGVGELGAAPAQSIPASAFDPRFDGDTVRRGGNRYTVQSNDADEAFGTTGRVDRFTVGPGDVWRNDGDGVERAEVSGESAWPLGQDVWVSFSLRVPAESDFSDSWTVVGQFHATPDPADGSASPVFAQEFQGDRFRVVTRSSRQDPLRENPSPVVRFGPRRLQRDVWHHFVYHLRFDPDGGGLLRAWKDGERIITDRSIALGYEDDEGPYWKYGVYRDAAEGTSTVEYANMQVSSESLRQRVRNPLPITRNS